MIPVKFRKSQEAVVSYDTADLASGVGFIILYGTATTDSVGVDYVLNRNVTTGRPLYITSGLEPGFDLDFDITVTKNMTIQGIATINCKFGEIDGGSGAGVTRYIVFTLRKYSGTTETDIASVQTESYVTTGATRIRTQLQMSVPKTNFKVGDILRLTAVSHQNPEGRATQLNFDAETSADTLKLFLPVKIQV